MDEEDWNLDALLTEIRLYFPTEVDQGRAGRARRQQRHVRAAGGRGHRLLRAARGVHARARGDGEPADTMRALEREIMLQLIDQKWREHLSEMDYLREGINLRAMGQQDPLVAWQRDGYEMFGQMMASIDDDYVKIVMHAQVQLLEQVQPDDDAAWPAPSTPPPTIRSRGPAGFQRALAAGPAPGEEVVFAPENGNGQGRLPRRQRRAGSRCPLKSSSSPR